MPTADAAITFQMRGCVTGAHLTGYNPPMPTVDTVQKYRWDDMPKETVTPLLDRRMIVGNRMMLAHIYLKKGCIVPLHSRCASGSDPKRRNRSSSTPAKCW